MKLILAIRHKVVEMLPGKVRYFIEYSRAKHKIPNLFKPRDYSEYIFRDILFNRNHKRAVLADKYRVRSIVESRGLQHILPILYGVWSRAEDIDFDSLPEKFALKCNHSCGMNVICVDKSRLDRANVIEILNRWLHEKHPIYFESHYNRIKPVIICEEYISDDSGVFPMDYKIHCAHGEPVFIQCCYDRNEESVGKRIIYDMQWRDLSFVTDESHHADHGVDKPVHLEEMLEYASVLSQGLDYARIDLYDTEDRVFFGEITLTPMGGWLSYFSQEALNMMGDRIRKGQTPKRR